MTIASQSDTKVPSNSNKAYTKVINDNLSISLAYGDSSDPACRECILTFHNTSKTKVIVNPNGNENHDEPKLETPTGGWFNNIFGRPQQQEQEHEKGMINDHTQPLEIFLGYVQLFGYIALNYRFSMDANTFELNRRGMGTGQWCNNIDYLNQYLHNDFEHDEDIKIDEAPFLQNRKLVVGGKLGGVGDLIVNKEKDIQVDSTQGYLLHDLIYPFNSKLQTPHSSYQLSLKELTDAIYPIYATPQSLLFTNLKIEPGSTQTFHFKLPIKDSLPPSYNTRLTGPASDQGWSSIHYSLVLTIQDRIQNSKLQNRSVYFPVNIDPQRVGKSHRYIQRRYLQEPIVLDKEWRIQDMANDKPYSTHILPSRDPEARDGFLQDLTSLIDSDLYNMPKMSTSERKKSIVEHQEEEEQIYLDSPDYSPQLPVHLKTQYQLRVNNNELCLISLSRPYFHVGEDIHYILDINRKESSTKVIGLISYLEAHEIYHCENGYKLVNVYKVTGNRKVNTFASAMIDSCKDQLHTNCLVNGHKHIPRFLTPQFQSSFIDLKYYLVFHFNLSEFGEDEQQEGKSQQEKVDSGKPEMDEPASDGNVNEHLIHREHRLTMDGLFETNRTYKFDAVGSGNKFKVPIYLLP